MLGFLRVFAKHFFSSQLPMQIPPKARLVSAPEISGESWFFSNTHAGILSNQTWYAFLDGCILCGACFPEAIEK
jgi:hypothetical protein